MTKRLKTRKVIKKKRPESRSSVKGKSRTSTVSGRSANKTRPRPKSKTARKLISITKLAKKYQEDLDKYVDFLHCVNSWFASKVEDIWNIICKIHADELESITYDSFKAIMMDVEAPFSDVEIHILTMLLDPDTEGSIQIHKFSQGIYRICKEEEMRITKLIPSPLIKPLVRWVRVHFKNATFASIPFHPLHFQEDVPAFYTTDFLADIIRRQNHTCTPSLKMFIKRNDTPPQRINQIGATLNQLGIKGGTKFAPEEVTILYESECKFDSSITSYCTTSIDDCSLLWDEASLWLEEIFIEESVVKTKNEISKLVSGSSDEDSDASSVVSLATYLTMVQRARRRAKQVRRKAKKCEQRIRASEVSLNGEDSEESSIKTDSSTS